MVEYPPYLYIIRCIETSPVAIITYILLWKRSSSDSDIIVSKEKVVDEYITNLPNFIEHLFLLEEAKLLEFTEQKNHFTVRLSPLQIKAEGLTLC